jgi:epoxyqueuosine reductase QueG
MTINAGTARSLNEDLESLARSQGVEIYGVASVQKYAEVFPNKPQPTRFVPGAKSIIIIGLPFTQEILDTVAKPWLAEIHRKAVDQVASESQRPPAGAERYYFGPENEMLTHEVGMIGYRLAHKLHRDGFKAFYFPSVQSEPRFKTAPFYYMPAMYLAGIGQLGMNCCIINPKFGPLFRVTSVITNADLPSGEPLGGMHYQECKSCLECVRRCPSKALNGNYWKNVFACASYGCCGTCLSVCPAGRNA